MTCLSQYLCSLHMTSWGLSVLSLLGTRALWALLMAIGCSMVSLRIALKISLMVGLRSFVIIASGSPLIGILYLQIQFSQPSCCNSSLSIWHVFISFRAYRAGQFLHSFQRRDHSINVPGFGFNLCYTLLRGSDPSLNLILWRAPSTEPWVCHY